MRPPHLAAAPLAAAPLAVTLAAVFALAVCLPLLAACSYAPPAQTDTASPRYQADLDACTTSVPAAVDKRNAKTGLAWMTGGLTRWSAIDSGVDACMDQHGWGHVRACTADELRGGDRTRSLVVTARGVRCSDPNRSS